MIRESVDLVCASHKTALPASVKYDAQLMAVLKGKKTGLIQLFLLTPFLLLQ